MKCDKDMGMDVHQAMTVIAVLDGEGKVALETMMATESGAIIRCVQSLRGPRWVTFEEGTAATWLYEVLRPTSRKLSFDPCRNKLLDEGSKADKVDARKLAELLRAGLLRSVYHGHEATRRLKELGVVMKRYPSIPQRTISRIKAISRGRGIATPGRGVDQHRQREQWSGLLAESGIRERAMWL
jgi:hypothetical protein